MKISRRTLLRSGSLAFAGLAASPVLGTWNARAGISRPDPVLVTLFLRGAADGLSLVVPHGDADYYAQRPNIQVPAGDEVDLDGFFGLHPHLQPLEPLYTAGHLGIVHACGSPHPSRSHFDAQDFMETGRPGVKNAENGWLARHLETTAGDSKLRGISVTGTMPRILAGGTDVYAASTLTALDLGRGQAGVLVRDAIGTMYLGREDLLGKTVGETLDNYEIFTDLGDQGYQPRNDAIYPSTPLGRARTPCARSR